MTDANHPQFREIAFWKRTLYMLALWIAYSIAELIVGFIVVVQFITILFTGRANAPLLRFGNNASAYVRQILRFVQYNTEEMPFPFSEWPDEPADGDRWRGAAARSGEDFDWMNAPESDAHGSEPAPPAPETTVDRPDPPPSPPDRPEPPAS